MDAIAALLFFMGIPFLIFFLMRESHLPSLPEKPKKLSKKEIEEREAKRSQLNAMLKYDENDPDWIDKYWDAHNKLATMNIEDRRKENEFAYYNHRKALREECKKELKKAETAAGAVGLGIFLYGLFKDKE